MCGKTAKMQEKMAKTVRSSTCLPKTPFSTKKRTLRRNGRFLEATKLRVLLRFFDSDSHRDGRADHRVVAHAEEAHHLDVRRNGAGARELRIGVHTAKCICEAIRSRTCSHVIGMQGTAGTAAGSYGEVLLALFNTLFLVCSCNRMLETGRVCRVTCNGYVYALFVHDSNTFLNVVCSIAVNFSTKTFRIRFTEYFFYFVLIWVILCLNECESVNTGNNLCCIFSKTVQNNAKRFLTNFVCLLSDTDSTFCCGKGLMSCKETETLCLFFQKHFTKVTMSKTYFACISY